MRGSAAARLRRILAGVAFSFSTGTAGAAELQEPITLQSRNGVLDILLVAKAAVIPSLFPLVPTGWVYDICLNPHNGSIARPKPVRRTCMAARVCSSTKATH
jgi:hypothetical protein